MKKAFICVLLFIISYCFLVRKAGEGYNTYVPGDYHSTLHADAAGYNVYLPALSPYAFAGNFPDNMDAQSGYGFLIDKNKKVITKYTYGIALLQSPFYFAGKYYAKTRGIEFTGYSPFNHKLVDYAGIFYGLLGLFLLFFFLKHYFNWIVSLSAVLILFLAFNILWYIVVQPGMSHVYSFFLFCLFILSSQRFYLTKKTIPFVFVCLSAAFIVLIRPVNIIVLPVVFFLPMAPGTLKDRLLLFIKPSRIIVAGLIAIAVFIPQIIYWKFAYGEYLPDTYPNESFVNKWHPHIKSLFFAAKSGIIPYNPIYLLVIPFVIWLAIKSKEHYYKTILFIYAALAYLCAAWYEYFFGCGFGNRNFAEYSVLLAFPIAWILSALWRRKLMLITFLIFSLACIGVNIKLTESFDMCFFGKDIWDYDEYKYLLLNHYEKKEISFDDSLSYYDRVNRVKDPWNPSNIVSQIASETEFGSVIKIPVADIGNVIPRKVEFSIEINPVKDNFSSEVVVQVMRDKQQIFFQAVPFSTVDPVLEPYSFYSPLPEDLRKTDEILIFFWNRQKKNFYVDNYLLNFR
jgi:hypothetical protein